MKIEKIFMDCAFLYFSKNKFHFLTSYDGNLVCEFISRVMSYVSINMKLTISKINCKRKLALQ